MGLIIPWKDIREGRIASVSDYERTAEDALRAIGAHPKIFKGAAFIGSIARGDLCAPRSDLDLFMVAHNGEMGSARSMARDFRRTADDRRVYLELDLVSAFDAYFSPHLGPSYRETLTRCHPEYSVGVPLAQCFRVSPGDVQAEMVRKMAFKLRSARARYAHFLRTCLELEHGSDRAIEAWLVSSWSREVRPMRMHIRLGRRLLWWHHGHLQHDGKDAIIAQVLSEPAYEMFHTSYTELVQLNRRYDVLLASAREGNVKRVHYLRMVGRLVCQYFSVSIPLLEKVVDFMTSESIRCAA
ncbi:MAG: hypothetical protein HQ488_04310 [Parcubacteria group bacterium]|nr:hypothetical protein [Parcubacteria group bacterium]